ncbi:MAG: GGDEF domain-containing protein [Candidatus Hydrothermales bacterium]
MVENDRIKILISNLPYVLNYLWDRNKTKMVLKELISSNKTSFFLYKKIKNKYVLIESSNVEKNFLPEEINYRDIPFKESYYHSSLIIDELENAIIFPFFSYDKAIGFIGTLSKSLCEDEILYFYVISLLIELIEFQEKVEELVTKDDLTELSNSKYFLVSLRKFLSDKNNYPVTVIIMDLDNFKEINDIHGHFVGGKVLQKVGEFLKNFFLLTDYSYAVISRYGGDEFAFLFPKTTLEEGVIIANTIRKELEEHSIKIKENLNFNIKASFGVSSFPKSTDKPEKLLVIADKALFEAKKKGKNYVYSIPSVEKT